MNHSGKEFKLIQGYIIQELSNVLKLKFNYHYSRGNEWFSILNCVFILSL